MSRHIAVLHVEFTREPDDPAVEAIADTIAQDVQDFLLPNGMTGLGEAHVESMWLNDVLDDVCSSCGKETETILPSGRCQNCEDMHQDDTREASRNRPG